MCKDTKTTVLIPKSSGQRHKGKGYGENLGHTQVLLGEALKGYSVTFTLT